MRQTFGSETQLERERALFSLFQPVERRRRRRRPWRARALPRQRERGFLLLAWHPFSHTPFWERERGRPFSNRDAKGRSHPLLLGIGGQL